MKRQLIAFSFLSTSVLFFFFYSTNSHLNSSIQNESFKLEHVFHSSEETFKQFSTLDISSNAYSSYQQSSLLPFAIPLSENGYPDSTDPQSVLALATMTLNAYFEPEHQGWRNVPGWNKTTRFGWENDGIRGYVYASDQSYTSAKTVVITFKGTSARWIGGGGITSPRDKLNDNLMFSCCCATVDRTWTPSCSCKTAENQCSASCIQDQSNIPDSYYNLAQTIFLAVRGMYGEDTRIWVTGHSLGGSLASLVALTNDIPAFTFEAPGDLLFASRIGLIPNGVVERNEFMRILPIYHYGNDGDPIFVGKCIGPGSTCYWGGYAMESRCHTGNVCTYPLNSIKKTEESTDVDATGLDIRHHGIQFMIDEILSKEPPVPLCQVEVDCVDCEQWHFN